MWAASNGLNNKYSLFFIGVFRINSRWEAPLIFLFTSLRTWFIYTLIHILFYILFFHWVKNSSTFVLITGDVFWMFIACSTQKRLNRLTVMIQSRRWCETLTNSPDVHNLHETFFVAIYGMQKICWFKYTAVIQDG